MKFSVFSHADHYLYEDKIFSYGPYVREMNYWISEFDSIEIIAPCSDKTPNLIDLPYKHTNIKFCAVPDLHFKKSFLKSILSSFEVIKTCLQEMKRADHIHLRCPGNIGMLAMMISSLFPGKPKTIKYAGNWDPNSKQPFSYRFQKWWLSNTFLTRNAKVLVYGDWNSTSKNIIPFFTASFLENERISKEKSFVPPFRFLFCGNLVEGKRPMLALKIFHQLSMEETQISLDIYGDGSEKQKLIDYVKANDLENLVRFHGYQDQNSLRDAYKMAHFCILASKSEGWPKVLAEAMFYGCIPVSTEVSCIPWMLDRGNRGILVQPDTENAVQRIQKVLKQPSQLKSISNNARNWSQHYTLEKFRDEIHKLL